MVFSSNCDDLDVLYLPAQALPALKCGAELDIAWRGSNDSSRTGHRSHSLSVTISSSQVRQDCRGGWSAEIVGIEIEENKAKEQIRKTNTAALNQMLSLWGAQIGFPVNE